MATREELAEYINGINFRAVQTALAGVPFASHLTDENVELNSEYYLRHRVETIKRIRLTAKTDAIALAQMIDVDYDAARHWSRYLAEELDHDRLYLADLRQHGYTDEKVHAIDPFPATKAMLAYLHEQLRKVGPLAAVAYSLFVEWNSERASERVVEKAESQFSKRHAAGSRAHLGIDEDEDHYQMMVAVAHKLLTHHVDHRVLGRLLEKFSIFFAEYFRELYQTTVWSRPSGVATM